MRTKKLRMLLVGVCVFSGAAGAAVERGGMAATRGSPTIAPVSHGVHAVAPTVSVALESRMDKGISASTAAPAPARAGIAPLLQEQDAAAGPGLLAACWGLVALIALRRLAG